MQPKLVKQHYVEYVPGRYNGVNGSGWKPINDYVLVLPDQISSKSSGGVELPEDLADRMQAAAITGTVIDMGGDAFSWNSDRTRPFGGEKPKPGTRVVFEKYAGKVILGKDGETYRILDDKAIGGIQA